MSFYRKHKLLNRGTPSVSCHHTSRCGITPLYSQESITGKLQLILLRPYHAESSRSLWGECTGLNRSTKVCFASARSLYVTMHHTLIIGGFVLFVRAYASGLKNHLRLSNCCAKENFRKKPLQSTVANPLTSDCFLRGYS